VGQLPTRWGWHHSAGAAATALRSVPSQRGQSGTRWTWPPSGRRPLPATPPSVRGATAKPPMLTPPTATTRTAGMPRGRPRTARVPFATARSGGCPIPRGAPPNLAGAGRQGAGVWAACQCELSLSAGAHCDARRVGDVPVARSRWAALRVGAVARARGNFANKSSPGLEPTTCGSPVRSPRPLSHTLTCRPNFPRGRSARPVGGSPPRRGSAPTCRSAARQRGRAAAAATNSAICFWASSQCGLFCWEGSLVDVGSVPEARCRQGAIGKAAVPVWDRARGWAASHRWWAECQSRRRSFGRPPTATGPSPTTPADVGILPWRGGSPTFRGCSPRFGST